MSSGRGLVAVTGANGTIGYHCVVYALQAGYRVRCVVRREDAIATINAGPSLQPFLDKVEYAVVPDNTVPDAYDEAMHGVSYIVHIAGVWPKPNFHPDNDIWYPFVRSMDNVLSAAKKAGTVKRVVFTQAGAGLVSRDDGDTLGTNMDHILNEYVQINEQSAALRPPLKTPHHAYCGAKAKAMSYLKSLKDSQSLPFSIAQVIPGTVMGSSELITGPEAAKAYLDRMSKNFLFNTPRAVYAFAFVSVQDCARVHVEALDEVKVPADKVPDWWVAGATTEDGQTIKQIWDRVGNMIQEEFEDEVERGLFEVGKGNWPINVPFRVDSRLTERMLLGGNEFKSLLACVREVAHWYKSLAGDGARVEPLRA